MRWRRDCLACARVRIHGYDIRTAKARSFSSPLQVQQLSKYSINNINFILSNFNSTNPILSNSILKQPVHNVNSTLTNSNLKYFTMVSYQTTCGCKFEACGAATSVKSHFEATCGCKFYPCGEVLENNDNPAFQSHDSCADPEQTSGAEPGLQQEDQPQDARSRFLHFNYSPDEYNEFGQCGGKRPAPFLEQPNLKYVEAVIYRLLSAYLSLGPDDVD